MSAYRHEIKENKPACLVLAAGQGSRFGGIKQLADIGEQPLISHTVDLYAEIFRGRIYVVLGAIQSIQLYLSTKIKKESMKDF